MTKAEKIFNKVAKKLTFTDPLYYKAKLTHPDKEIKVKSSPKKVFTDPLYHKAQVLEGAGIVSKDKPLKSAPLLEKARLYAKKMTGKMPSKKAIGAVAAGIATGYFGGKALKGEK